MATRVFSDEELEGLRSFPAIGKDELIRYFTLTPADEAFLKKFRRAQNVLGAAVQLSTLPWLGFVPDDVPSAPGAAVGRPARQLGLAALDLAGYGEREQTRTDHLREIADYLGWKPAKAIEHKELDEFLLARAMEHDSPSLLFRLGCEYLRSAKVIRPGVVTLLEKVAAARQAAEQETHARVAHLLTEQRAEGLDGLLVFDAKLRSSRLHWLGTGPVQASPNSVGSEVEKLKFLRSLDAHPGFVRAARRTPPPPRPDRAPADRAGPGPQGAEPSPPDPAHVAGAVRGRRPRLRRPALRPDPVGLRVPREDQAARRTRRAVIAANAGATVRLPRDHGHLRLLAGSYTYIRQFAPKVLEAVSFEGGTEAEPLIEALGS
ncbi:DUF4158 domain-containing protein [Streptomyces sp. NPDC054775]